MSRLRKKKRSLSWYPYRWMPYLYVLPGLVFVGLFVLGSVGLTFFVGLTKWPTFEHPQWIGLKNYTELFFNDSTFIICLRNNLYWVLVSLGLIPLAFMLAVLIDEFKRAADYFRTLIFTPSTLSLVVVGLMFGFVYSARSNPGA